MKSSILLFLALFFGFMASGQLPKKKTGFYLIPEICLIKGDNGISRQFQLTTGIQKKSWMFGVGAAIEDYEVRTVPVFADVKFGFGKKRYFFSYTDIGADLIWRTISQYDGNRQGSGMYADLGLGYAFRGIMKKGFVVSAGYTIKTFTEWQNNFIYQPFAPYELELNQRRLVYTFNRITIRIGFRF